MQPKLDTVVSIRAEFQILNLFADDAALKSKLLLQLNAKSMLSNPLWVKFIKPDAGQTFG